MSRSLKEICVLQEKFDKRHHGAVPFFERITDHNIQSLEHLVVCVAGELGELANITKKIRRGDYTLSEQRDNVCEEVADIFIYILKISNQLGIDLEDAYLKKLSANEERFSEYEHDRHRE